MLAKRINSLFESRKIAGTIAAIALAVIVGGSGIYHQEELQFPSSIDPILSTEIIEDEVPLAAAPTVTTKTTTKTTKQKVTLSEKATKTYTETLPKKTKKAKSTSTNDTAKIVTETKVVTVVKEKYTKGSKKKVVTTKVTTTVTTTTTPLETEAVSAPAPAAAPAVEATTENTVETTTAAASASTVPVRGLASMEAENVLSAFEKLGFSVIIDPSVSYSGYYDTKSQSITLRKADDTIYHELGHFISFLCGVPENGAEFTAIYNEEKGKYTRSNVAYVTGTPAEYFAESCRDYILYRNDLMTNRPKTYEYIARCYSMITDSSVAMTQMIYASYWK